MPAVDYTRVPLIHLAWPMLVENILRTSLMSIDTLMLGRYSSDAVGAMSLAGQLSFFIQLLYTMVSIGASVLITQNLGGGRPREAGRYGVASLVLMVAVSLAVSLLIGLGAPTVIALYGLEPAVERYASQFLVVYGGFSFFMAINIAQASILRAWGYTRDPMLVNVLCLALTAGGNALCLFGPLGFPVLGVTGVAVSTVASQAIACALSAWMIRRRRTLELPLREARQLPRAIYRTILAIGIPTAGENLAYNMSQIAILALLSRMGTVTLATYGILLAMLRYVFMPGVSIGAAGQLVVGYLVGGQRYDEASRRVYRYAATGFSISLALVVLLELAHVPLLGWFSDDPRVRELAASVLVIALVFEPGRNLNTTIIPALKGAGDIRFPIIFGVLSMWGVSVFGAWLLGIHWGLGLVGVWIAMATDEWLRGLAMLWRWRSGAWRDKRLVRAPVEAEVVAVGELEVEEGR